jgi:hypothetical protein
LTLAISVKRTFRNPEMRFAAMFMLDLPTADRRPPTADRRPPTAGPAQLRPPPGGLPPARLRVANAD